MIMDYIYSLSFGEIILLALLGFLVVCLSIVLFIALCAVIYGIFTVIVSKLFGADLEDVYEFGRICKESDHTASWVLSNCREFINNYDKG